ncbi:MAG: hypothetical protein QOE74_2508 [Mycobacterium sp.]|nr:hypothetical protein [Mycobacterium sp.]
MPANVNVAEHRLMGLHEGVEWSHPGVHVVEMDECGLRHVVNDREDRRFLSCEVAGEGSGRHVDCGGDLVDRGVRESVLATQLDGGIHQLAAGTLPLALPQTRWHSFGSSGHPFQANGRRG